MGKKLFQISSFLISTYEVLRGFHDCAERSRGGDPFFWRSEVEMVAANAVAPDPAALNAYGAPMQQWTQDAMYVRRVQELILNQVNYYFSTENLCKDEFLRVHMDGEGWVPIPLLASFARLRRLTTDLAILTEARATRLPVSSCTHTTPPSPPPCPAAGTVLLA